MDEPTRRSAGGGSRRRRPAPKPEPEPEPVADTDDGQDQGDATEPVPPDDSGGRVTLTAPSGLKVTTNERVAARLRARGYR